MFPQPPLPHLFRWSAVLGSKVSVVKRVKNQSAINSFWTSVGLCLQSIGLHTWKALLFRTPCNTGSINISDKILLDISWKWEHRLRNSISAGKNNPTYPPTSKLSCPQQNSPYNSYSTSSLWSFSLWQQDSELLWHLWTFWIPNWLRPGFCAPSLHTLCGAIKSYCFIIHN